MPPKNIIFFKINEDSKTFHEVVRLLYLINGEAKKNTLVMYLPTPPILACSGLPLEESSVLIFKTQEEGKVHLPTLWVFFLKR